MQVDFRDEWLSELGQRLNLPRLTFDHKGLCQLSLDQELAITLYKQPDAPNLVLFGQLPIEHFSPELMRQMLIENRNHSKLAAPVLSLSDHPKALEVHFKLNQEELATTEDALGELIGSLEYWRSYMVAA